MATAAYLEKKERRAVKCPCCKIINTLNEALKHPSVTSIHAALHAWESFKDTDKTKLALAVFPCPKHGSESMFDSFIVEANEKRRLLCELGR
jgi:phage FluMu protein Com